MTDQPQRSRRYYAGRPPLRRGLAVLMAIALGAAARAQAANLVVSTVADSGPGSLREAIEQANAMAEPSTITFSVSGRIELASAFPPITGTLTVDGTGRSIIIDGTGSVRPFLVDGSLVDATLTVRRLTITNGWSRFGGGGILNVNGILHAEHSIVAGNRADDSGGGIYTSGPGGIAIVRQSTISGNSTRSGGGAIFISGGTLNVLDSTISGNRAGIGGGLMALSGSDHIDVYVSNSTISGNSTGSGGGIENSGGSFGRGSLRLINSTVSGNSGDGI